LLTGIAGYLGYQAWRIEAVFLSDPPGAVVRIDGRGIGLTPLTVPLDPGRHRVEFTHSHYQSIVENVLAERGDRIERTVVLRPGLGRLSLLSNPIGAWVDINGERQPGATPMEVEIPSGPTSIRMGLTERRAVEKEVIVLPDQTVTANLALDMDPHGSLFVSVTPSDARVRLPELELDYSPGVRVPIGEQLVEVSRPGFETMQIRFDVRYGDNHTRIELSRAMGEIRVLTTPAEASVTLTYEKQPEVSTRVPYNPGMRLPIGRVVVSARALGYRTVSRTIDLTTGGASVNFTLSPMQVVVGEVFRDPLASGGRGPQMIVIPPGSFVMGDPGGPPSMLPATRRILSQPFAVSVNEVSIGEYLRYAEATGVEVDERLLEASEPVRYVRWAEAVAYADWLSSETGGRYRLPTEAEWEYMARAGTDTEFWFGDDVDRLCEFANLADLSTRKIYREWAVLDCDDGYGKLAPVGRFPANPFGVRDVHGNVSEWVLECGMPPYSRAAEDGTEVMVGQSCNTHGVRGGSWDGQPEALRSRRRAYARGRGDDRGIRLLKEL
jgi:formylglycine-generating enzyme required for sulfatase activity